jgi:hypothetical protein
MLLRPGDTRWSSNVDALERVLLLWPVIKATAQRPDQEAARAGLRHGAQFCATGAPDVSDAVLTRFESYFKLVAPLRMLVNMLQSDSATLVTVHEAMCMLDRHCREVAGNDVCMESAAKRLRGLLDTIYNKHLNIPAVHAAALLTGSDPLNLSLVQPVGALLENLAYCTSVRNVAGLTASAAPLPTVEDDDDDDAAAARGGGAAAATAAAAAPRHDDAEPPARRVQPPRLRQKPLRYQDHNQGSDSEDESSDDEPHMNIYEGATGNDVHPTDDAAYAAARSEFAAENPTVQLPGEGNANAARAFVSAWGAAYAGKHLRKVFAPLQLGSVAEIATMLDAEFLAFCSRRNGTHDDAFADFDATVSQQQQRAKARNAPWSWASIWHCFFMTLPDKPAALGARLLATVAGALLSIVPHEAAVERTFSGHKRVHSQTRARLRIEHVRNEMAIRYGHCQPTRAQRRARPAAAAEIPVSSEDQAIFDLVAS